MLIMYHRSFKTDDNIAEPQIKGDASPPFHPVMWIDVVSGKLIFLTQYERWCPQTKNCNPTSKITVAARSTCGSSAARLLGLWVRIPLRAWIYVSCESCVLSGRGLSVGLIVRPEDSYRVWCDRLPSKKRKCWPTRGSCPVGTKSRYPYRYLFCTVRHNGLTTALVCMYLCEWLQAILETWNFLWPYIIARVLCVLLFSLLRIAKCGNAEKDLSYQQIRGLEL
jgi:hypothetical protein